MRRLISGKELVGMIVAVVIVLVLNEVLYY